MDKDKEKLLVSEQARVKTLTDFADWVAGYSMGFCQALDEGWCDPGKIKMAFGKLNQRAIEVHDDALAAGIVAVKEALKDDQ